MTHTVKRTKALIQFYPVGANVQIRCQFPQLTQTIVKLGDPVPVFTEGPKAGFHAHDVAHVMLLCETGWSAVLDILLAGKNNGVFGGPDALAEEAVILGWFMHRKCNPVDDAMMLDTPLVVQADIEQAFKRAAREMQCVIVANAAGLPYTVTVDDYPQQAALEALAFAVAP